MKLRFTLEALHHISAIHFYVESRNSVAARHIVKRIYADCDRLLKFPKLGRAGFVAGTFEWTVSRLPYIVVYEIDAKHELLIVLGVFHGSRER